MKTWLFTRSLRSKLLVGYLPTFIVSIVLGNLVIFMVVRNTIVKNTEKELTNTTNIIMNMVKSAADASIKNHLRAVAEKNNEIVLHYYGEYQKGRLNEAEAQEKAGQVLLSQSIGKTGYIYCVNSKGMLQVHPKINGADLSKHDFIRQQIQVKEGYLEYDWANPGEEKPRRKALYMTYFGPWDWILSVSSYREEFKDLFKVDDFRESILAISFGKTGYPYVMDSLGNLIIHPKLVGHNIYNSKDTTGREFIKEICAKKMGKIIYPWQNPGEMEPRDKLVIFNYIPEFDWIVASSSYTEEFNDSLVTIGYASLFTLVLVILFIVPITFTISSYISRPIQEIISGFSQGSKGDYSSQIDTSSRDEIGQLAEYYNEFMRKLAHSSDSLRASEERFRLLFENAVEGVFTMTSDGKFLNANPSLARMLNYEGHDQFIMEVAGIGAKAYVDPKEHDRLLAELASTGMLTGFETVYRRRDGSTMWVALNLRAYMAPDGTITTIEGFCSDITEKKKAEETQIRVTEELEQRVAARTAELSQYIGKLERRNLQQSLLQEMDELLQVCRSSSESFAIIDKFVDRFFPDHSGALFLLDSGNGLLDKRIVWGNPDGIVNEFGRDECWALRQGKPYSVCGEGKRLFCSHVHEGQHFAYLCAPLIAQGEVLGLLYIHSSQTDLECKSWAEKMHGLAVTFTNHLGLSLANLKLQDRLWNQSMTDPLTGLYNRRFMEEFLELEILRSKRHNTPLSLIMIDVDHFKKVNDIHGHEAGDLVLKEIASYFKKHCRDSDVACRYGGEEFVVLLPSCSIDDAVARAQILCGGVREEVRIPYQYQTLGVTISIGVSSIPSHAMDMDEMLKAADAAMYQAKDKGRDQVVVAEVIEKAK
jgi:diguanylate cyclase (GGDEF)-like protein/PAS domain S-box-containing protein